MALYEDIAGELRTTITSGGLAPGDRLPTEPELRHSYGTSLSTIRKALQLLDAEGLVETRHGTGTFVREARQRLRRSTDRYQWEKDRVHLSEEERRTTGAVEYDSGLGVDQLTFTVDYTRVPADDNTAAALNVPVGEPLLRRVYATRKAGERAPLGVGISYLVISTIAANPALLDPAFEPWPGGTQHQLSTVGIEVDHIVDEVVARPPTVEEARLLDVRPGAAILAIRKTSIDTQGTPVEVNDIVWPGDRLQLVYTTQLKRWAD